MYIIGAVVALAVLILVFPFALRRPQPVASDAVPQTQAPATQQQVPPDGPVELPRMPRFVTWIVTALVSYVVTLLVLYPCLTFLGRLREGNFAANFTELAGTVLIVYMWGLIPFVGWFLGIMHFMRHYELSVVEAVGVMVVAGLCQAVILTFVVIPALAGAGFMLLGTAH